MNMILKNWNFSQILKYNKLPKEFPSYLALKFQKKINM